MKKLNSSVPEHYCCCGSVHVKIGTTVIAIGTACCLVFSLIVASVYGGNTAFISYVYINLGFIVVLCMFYGLIVERGVYLLPFIVMQIIDTVVAFVMIAICIVVMTSSNQVAHNAILYGFNVPKDTDVRVMAGILMSLFSIGIAFHIWFIWVIFQCYIYFSDD